MSKLKFVLPMAAALGTALLLSCSSIEEAIQESRCASNQGEWDAATKTCVACPSGTAKQPDGQCVASAIQIAGGTYICPARTTKNADGLCVADVIAVDPNAAPGKYYCDYGKIDSTGRDTEGGCYEIEYESQCNTTWGKLVPSCQAQDRRTDTLMVCDYGPEIHCIYISNPSQCESEWGIIASECGKHGNYPDGTVCPIGKTKIKVDELNINVCRELSEAGIVDSTAAYCDLGEPYISNSKLQGGCRLINDQRDRSNCLLRGKGVNNCPNYNVPDYKYCYDVSADECYVIGYGSSFATEAECEERYSMVVQNCNNADLD